MPRGRRVSTRRLIAVLALLWPLPAGADDSVPAELFLAPACASAACRAEAARFVDVWRDAQTGDYVGERAVAECLLSGCGGAVRIDSVHGCAWRLILIDGFARGGNDAGFRAGDTLDSAVLGTQASCGGLRRTDSLRAVGLARGLSRRIHGTDLIGLVADTILQRRP